MVHFLYHTSCPKCGSKDNLGVYSDGHEYCFGCHYYKRGNYISSLRTSINKAITQILETSSWSKHLPEQCKQWLGKYALTASELDSLDLYWDSFLQLLIFPVKKDNTLIGYIGRNFNTTGSKYVVRGEKQSFDILYGKGSTLVFTEDIISALKVSRLTAAKPLLGTYLKNVPQGFDSYRLWLDKDKQISSVKQCKSWSQFVNITPIITDLDPKEYNTHQLQEILR